MATMTYHHTQSAPLYLILICIGVAMLIGGWLTPEMFAQIASVGSAGIMFLFAGSFRTLTVRDEGDSLSVRFGPLPLFKRRIVYAEIESVEQARTSIIEGWGIHLSPGGGWTWNLWGFDCVDVRYRKGGRIKRIRIGSDDSAQLAAFLKQRIGRLDK